MSSPSTRVAMDDAEYARLHAGSVRDPGAFWGRIAQRLDWITPPTQVKDTSFALDDFHIRWYADGVLNASVNCLDRHLHAHGDKVALIFERDDPSLPAESITSPGGRPPDVISPAPTNPV